VAPSAFNLRYEQERWPKIAFADVKDYQRPRREARGALRLLMSVSRG
jgi:hypothetical protein